MTPSNPSNPSWPLTPADELDAIRAVVVIRLGKSHPDVDDIASDCWIKLDRLRPSYDPAKSSPKTFIAQIVSSAIIDAHRRQASRARREEFAARPDTMPALHDDAAPTDDQVAMDSARETYCAVLTTLRQSQLEPPRSGTRLSIPTRAAMARLREMLGSRAAACIRGSLAFRRDIDLPRIPHPSYFAITFDKKNPFEMIVTRRVQSMVEAGKTILGIRAMGLESLPRRKYCVPTNEAAKLMGWSVVWLLEQAKAGKFSYLPGKPNLFAMEELIAYDQSRVVPRRVAEREILVS